MSKARHGTAWQSVRPSVGAISASTQRVQSVRLQCDSIAAARVSAKRRSDPCARVHTCRPEPRRAHRVACGGVAPTPSPAQAVLDCRPTALGCTATVPHGGDRPTRAWVLRHASTKHHQRFLARLCSQVRGLGRCGTRPQCVLAHACVCGRGAGGWARSRVHAGGMGGSSSQEDHGADANGKGVRAWAMDRVAVGRAIQARPQGDTSTAQPLTFGAILS